MSLYERERERKLRTGFAKFVSSLSAIPSSNNRNSFPLSSTSTLTRFIRTMSDRTALLSSAISFLRDPSTASSPLAQRIAFLESKGLNQQEIEQALSAANGGPLMPYNNNGGGRAQGGVGGFSRGREFERDWRDYFIMSVVGGGVGWLAVKLAQVSLTLSLQRVSKRDRERLVEFQGRVGESLSLKLYFDDCWSL